MLDRRSEMRTWKNKLYNLQREAPKPLPIACTEHLGHIPPQYGSAYHGPLSRQGTEELLNGQPSGAYLIRDSQRADDAYTLAIRFDDSTKNYKLFYDPVTKLHFVGEKKFESVDQLVADGLIYLYIETRGADILQKLSEASNYEHSPYYMTRYHTVNAIPTSNRPSVIRDGVCRRQASMDLSVSEDNRMNSSSARSMQNSDNGVITDAPDAVPGDLITSDVISNGGDVITDCEKSSIPEKPLKEISMTITPLSQPSSLALMRRKTSLFRVLWHWARSTSLPFPKPPRTENSNTTAPKQAPTDSAIQISSGSSSGHASLKSEDSLKLQQQSAERKGKPHLQQSQLQPKDRPQKHLHHQRAMTTTLPPQPPIPSSHAFGGTGDGYLPDVEKAHNFRVHTFRGPHWCDYCTHFIWGLVSQGVKCTDCGFQAHKRCSISVPNDCLPDMKRLKRVFGVDLTSLVRAENRTLPQVLVKCIAELERRGGLEMEGVYRVPGNQEIVEDFRIALDKDCESVDLSEKHCGDLNTITSLIKSFLRQLPIPLITYDAYPELIDITRDDQLSDVQKLDLLKGCIQRLPPAHYYCLRYLMAHLNRVADHQQLNMMSSENLAIVFAPSLMSSSYTDPMSCLAGAKFEQAVINRLIADYAAIFEGEDCVPPQPPISASASTTASRSTTASSASSCR